MSETIMKKRLLGKEDIHFDLDGSGGVQYYTDADGVQYPVHKLNAGHLPLTAATRTSVGGGAETVEDALKQLAKRVPDAKLTANQTVTFNSSLSNTEMQTQINALPKNLNGNNLIIEFPAGMNFYLHTALLFDGFYNGQIYLNGNDDRFTGASDAILAFHCDARVTINKLDLHYESSSFAITNTSCKMTIRNCSFTGNADKTNYAVYCNMGHVCFENCTFDSEKHVQYSGMVKDDINALDKKIGNLQTAWAAYPEQIQSQLAQFPQPAEYIASVTSGGVSLETSTDNQSYAAAQPVYYKDGAVLGNATGALSSGTAILRDEREIHNGGIQVIRVRIQKAAYAAFYSTDGMGTNSPGTFYKLNFPAMATADYEVNICYEGVYDKIKRLNGLHYATYNRTSSSFCVAGLLPGNNDAILDDMIMYITIRGQANTGA